METPGVPDPKTRVEKQVNCAICGASLRGVELGGDCPVCRTPVMLSVTQGQATARGNADLVPEDRLCAKCGRNLRGLPSDGFCPECRMPIAQSAPVAVASGAKVKEDRPCLVCGYNIKGLETEGSCPECGTPVARSLRGFLLRYSAPDYLRTLMIGIIIVEVMLIVEIVFGLGVMVYSMANGFSTAMKFKASSTATAVVPGQPLALQAAEQIGGALLKWVGLWGLWLFSSPDPGLASQDPGYRARRFLRLFLTISALVQMGAAVLLFIPGMQNQLVAAAGGITGIAKMLTIVFLVTLLAGGAQLVGFVATMNYMAHLSRRIPDIAIERKAKQFRWLLPVLYVFGCGIGAIVAFVMYIILLEDWRKRLKNLNEGALMDGVSILKV